MDVSRADRPDSARSWGVALGAMACLVVGPSALLVSCFGVLVGPLSQEFGWTRGQIGAAVSFMAAAIMIASIIQGALIDRLGVRRVVLTSIPLFALSLAGLRWLPDSLPVFYACWFLLPFAAVGLWPGAYLKAVSQRFAKQLGLAIGVANAGIGVGTIVLPAVVAALIATFGLRDAFVGLGVLALLALPVAYVSIRETEPVGLKRADKGGWTYGAILKIAVYRRVLISFALLGIAGTGLVANLVPILMSKGLDPAVAIGGMAAFGVMNLIGRLVTGAMLDRLHVSIVFAILAASTVLSLIALVVGGSDTVFLVSAAILGLLSGGEFDVLAYTLRRFFGGAAFGMMYGLGFSAFQLGAITGAGVLATSVAATGRYDIGLLVLGAATTLSALLMAGIGPYPKAEALGSEGPRP